MWVHALYNWHAGHTLGDGYWLLQVPTKSFVSSSSDGGYGGSSPRTQTFAFPCYITAERTFNFNLPRRRREIDWRSAEGHS